MVRSCNRTFACQAYTAYPVPRIVRTYELKEGDLLFTSASIVIYSDNCLAHRAIAPQSITATQGLPMGSATCLREIDATLRGDDDRFEDNSAGGFGERL
jgi:hypothetical protein